VRVGSHHVDTILRCASGSRLNRCRLLPVQLRSAWNAQRVFSGSVMWGRARSVERAHSQGRIKFNTDAAPDSELGTEKQADPEWFVLDLVLIRQQTGLASSHWNHCGTQSPKESVQDPCMMTQSLISQRGGVLQSWSDALPPARGRLIKSRALACCSHGSLRSNEGQELSSRRQIRGNELASCA
jgi:hypothetical protein